MEYYVEYLSEGHWKVDREFSTIEEALIYAKSEAHKHGIPHRVEIIIDPYA